MFRQVHPSLWREAWFEALNPDAKLLFLYLTTCGDTSPAGFVVHSLPRLAFNLGLSQDRLDVAIHSLNGKVRWWPELSLFWIVRFWRWQGSGPKWLQAVRTDILSQPKLAQDAFYAEYPMDTLSIPHVYPIDGVGIPIGERSRRLKGTGKDTDKSTPSVVPPTGQQQLLAKELLDLFPGFELLELKDRFLGIDVEWEAQKCLDWWAASKKAMKRPKLAFRNWLEKAKPRTPAFVPPRPLTDADMEFEDKNISA